MIKQGEVCSLLGFTIQSKLEGTSMLFQFSVSFFYDFINLSKSSNFTLPALTSEELKKHHVVSLPLDFLHAPEDAALICFTSGLCFAPSQLHFLFMYRKSIFGVQVGAL